jgi:hypothetical protein
MEVNPVIAVQENAKRRDRRNPPVLTHPAPFPPSSPAGPAGGRSLVPEDRPPLRGDRRRR